MKIKLDYKILLLMIFFIIGQKLFVYLILLFCCIMHELGHVIVGIILGKKVEKIEILAIGCRVKFFETNEEENEIKEIIISLTGPIVNFAMIILLFIIPFDIFYKELYIYANFLIGVFNILPIYPLDGGRVVKSIIKIYNNELKVDEMINNISNITLIILTMLASILVIYYKNITQGLLEYYFHP